MASLQILPKRSLPSKASPNDRETFSNGNRRFMSDSTCKSDTCCGNTCSNPADVQLEAQSFGLSPEMAAEILGKYGPQVLTVIVAGLKSGLSLSFLLETLKLFGPMIVEFLSTLFTEKKKQVDAEVAKGLVAQDTTVADALAKGGVDGLPPAVANILMEKLLPWALDKYGQQIIQAIMEAIMKGMKEDSVNKV